MDRFSHIFVFLLLLWGELNLVHAAEWDVYQGDGFVVRSKNTSSEVCAGERGIAGYVDRENDHMFFWAFQSRNDPVKDPLILWLTGVPGASSIAFGAMQELGPCRFDGNSSTTYNPYAWNTNATVIFVDQPFGVGYSYSTSRNITTLKESTEDLYLFLEHLFEAQPAWKHLDFYIAGESYGGSYAPALASKIQQMRGSPLLRIATGVSSSKLSTINLKGMLVGNGLMDPTVQRRGLYETGCVGASPVLNATQCEDIARHAPECERLEEACKDSQYEAAVCHISNEFCQKHGWTLISQTPFNGYDFRLNCTASPHKCALIDDFSNLTRWLDSPNVREELGVDEAATTSPVSDQIGVDFAASGEVGYPSYPQVASILNQGIRVLIYAGNKDWLCNAAGMKYFVDGLVWNDQTQFRAAEFKAVRESCDDSSIGCKDGRLLWGWHKRYSYLSYMEVDQAGHLAPRDQPYVTLGMLNAWIAGYL